LIDDDLAAVQPHVVERFTKPASTRTQVEACVSV
jgi:hypothetical protein